MQAHPAAIRIDISGTREAAVKSKTCKLCCRMSSACEEHQGTIPIKESVQNRVCCGTIQRSTRLILDTVLQAAHYGSFNSVPPASRVKVKEEHPAGYRTPHIVPVEHTSA